MSTKFSPVVHTNMGLFGAIYANDGHKPQLSTIWEAAVCLRDMLIKAAEFHHSWRPEPERVQWAIQQAAEEAAKLETERLPFTPEMETIRSQPQSWGYVCGPFPSYANEPAWSAWGAKLTDGTVAVVGGKVTASLGMIAQGDAGSCPKAGIWAPGSDNQGARFVRPLAPDEQQVALAAVQAKQAHDEAWSKAWDDHQKAKKSLFGKLVPEFEAKLGLAAV